MWWFSNPCPEDLLRWDSLVIELDHHCGSSVVLQYTSVAATGFIFDAFANTAFLSATAVSVLRCTDVVIGTIIKLDVKSFFESPVAGCIGVEEVAL